MKFAILTAALLAAFTVNAGEIENGGSESYNLEGQKDKKIYLTFDNSPRLTEILRDQLKSNGFRMVDTEDSADVTVRMMSIYVFQKPHAKKMTVDFGKVVENDDGSLLKNKNEESFRTPNINLNVLQPNISMGVALGAGVVETVLQVAGVKSWFNKLLSGDERGWCLGTTEQCKDWKKYVQEVRMGAIVSPKAGGEVIVRSYAKTLDEQLVPGDLFQASFLEMSNRLTGTTGSPIQQASESAAESTNVQ